MLGGRSVEIERDTGRLFRSLSSGVEDRPSGAEEQVFRLEPGRVTVGTNVPYAHPQHNGIPGRLPARPFWPADGRLPQEWGEALMAALGRGLAKALPGIVSGGAT